MINFSKSYPLENICYFIILISFFANFLVGTVLGIKGFAIAPYLTGFVYSGFAFIVTIIFLKTNGNFILEKSINLIFILYLFMVGVSFFLGFLNDNSTIYLVAWAVYFSAFALLYLIGFSIASKHYLYKGEIFNYNWVLYFLFFINLFLKNGFSYVLLTSIAILNIFYSNNKKISIFMLVIAQFVFSGMTLKISLSRAALSCIFVGVLVSIFYLRQSLKIILAGIFLVSSYTFFIYAPNSLIENIPNRNIKEGIMLMRGDSLDNHIATAQRFYEVDLVIKDYENSSYWEKIFGLGYGRTLDMTQSEDASVGNAALEGGTTVNNVHFLPFAIFHKMGLAGVLFLVILISYLIFIFIKDTLKSRPNKTILFCYIYLFGLLIYAMPASNYLISNPLWALVLGYLIYVRKKV